MEAVAGHSAGIQGHGVELQEPPSDAMFAMFCSSKTILLLSFFLICLICFGLKGEQSQGVDGRAQSRPQVLKDQDVGQGSCPLIQALRRQAVHEDRHGKTASELSKNHECHLAENPQNTSKFESKDIKICGINSCLCAPILSIAHLKYLNVCQI